VQVGYGVVAARPQDRPVATSGAHKRIERLSGRHYARPPTRSWWSISACRLSQEHIGKNQHRDVADDYDCTTSRSGGFGERPGCGPSDGRDAASDQQTGQRGIQAEGDEPENDQRNSRCDRPHNSPVHERILFQTAAIREDRHVWISVLHFAHGPGQTEKRERQPTMWVEHAETSGPYSLKYY
jgi:hypothetical protein